MRFSGVNSTKGRGCPLGLGRWRGNAAVILGLLCALVVLGPGGVRAAEVSREQQE